MPTADFLLYIKTFWSLFDWKGATISSGGCVLKCWDQKLPHLSCCNSKCDHCYPRSRKWQSTKPWNGHTDSCSEIWWTWVLLYLHPLPVSPHKFPEMVCSLGKSFNPEVVTSSSGCSHLPWNPAQMSAVPSKGLCWYRSVFLGTVKQRTKSCLYSSTPDC